MTQVQLMERAERPIKPACLGEITTLLHRLHAANVQYCHWKSNEHLAPSLLGETDLDILVARSDVQTLAGILSATRFKRCLTAAARSYPGIESYIGLDEPSGRLIHLHAHYQLTLGEPYLKGYRLPWERLVLSTRVFSESQGIYVADPNLELLLLMVRSALKLRSRDRLLHRAGRPGLGSNAWREFAWLIARVEPQRLAAFAEALVGPRAARLAEGMITGDPPTRRALDRFRRSIEPELGECRTYSSWGARWRRWSRELWARRSGRRRLPQGGVVIALLGADGSGKSTLSRELASWLAGRLDVAPIYFGSGQGPASLARRLLQGAASLVKRTSRGAAASAGQTRRGQGSSPLRTVGEILWIVSLALERRRRTAEARRARNRGVIVVCDRFPQSQFARNEGPWLGHWMDHPSWVRRTVARQELSAIRCAERLRPDLVLKLNVTAQVALQRKPETPVALLHAKLGVLEQLRFAEETRVIEIDATRPFEQVLLEAKREVWRIL
ncbi:MAG: hypothetical protein ACREMX_05070 [Gemmatimonadales bacterium]